MWDIVRDIQKATRRNSVALDRSDLDEIKEAVVEAITEHACRFQMTDEEARKVSRVVSIFAEIGDNDLDSGLVVMRENHLWLQKRRKDMEPEYAKNHRFVTEMRQGIAVAKSASIKVLVTSLVTAVLGGLWLVFRHGRP